MPYSIYNKFQKIKYFLTNQISTDVLLVAVLILTGILSFGLGRMSVVAENKEPLVIKYPENQLIAKASYDTQISPNSSIIAPEGKIILASKNGKKYYFTDCSGASKIKPVNRVWFASEEEAGRAGLTKSATCKN